MKIIYPKNIKIPVLVDDKNFESFSQYNWFVNTKGYIYRNIRKSNGRWTHSTMHREILKTPKGVDCEHKDRNRANNQESNLRPSTRSQNMANVHKAKKDAAHSKYKGVSRLKRPNLKKQWVAYVKIDYQMINIGYFEAEAEAAHAYNQFAEQLFDDFACLNVIE